MYNSNTKQLFYEGLALVLELNDVIDEIIKSNVNVSDEIQYVIEELLYSNGAEEVFNIYHSSNNDNKKLTKDNSNQ
ncbi:hypothetical protein [Hypsugopox virus]|nr:hypothetical protein [Hypsugopox virus]